MRYFEYPRRLQDRKFRRLTLLIGTACAAEIALAREEGGRPPSSDVVPSILRPAQFLSAPKERPAKSASKAELRGLTRELSSVASTDDLPPALLRPARSLSKPKPRPRGRTAQSRLAEESSRLRMTSRLSVATNDEPQPNERPSRPTPTTPARQRIEGPEEPVTFSTVGTGARPAAPAPETPGSAQPEAPVAFEAVRPGPASTGSKTAASVPETLPDLTSVIGGWTIPPIRWGGSTTSNYNWNGSPGGNSTFSETQTLSLRASSYIYQPWYAQVSGDIGLLTGTSKQSGGDSSTSAGRSTSMTYGGNLSLFPQSRFPFQAYIQTSDSRASANAQSEQNTSLRMGARQSYRPEVGRENYSGSADRSIVTTKTLRSVVDAFQGNFSTTVADHGLSANARYSRNLGDIGGQGSNLFSLNAAHTWRADEELSVASSVTYSNNQIRLQTGGGLSMNNNQVMQATSSATWIPDEDLPLTIVGGGSFLHSNTTTETAKADLTNLNGHANASYRFSQNLTGLAGLTLTQSANSGTSQISSTQNASVSYLGNPLIFGDYSYNWGTGGGITNQVISGGAANRSISGQANHSLLRNITFSDINALTLTAGQSFSLSNNSSSGQNGVLTHTGGASWRLGLGERTLGTLSATASDSLSTGSFSSHFRSLSTQGNLQTQLGRRSALTASVNVVYSQQLATPQAPQSASPVAGETTGNGSSTLSGSGQVSYVHRSPFDIANLIYTATFQANASQTNLRLISGDPNALAWQTGNVLQQNVDYRLGRLIFRGTGSFATQNGKENASLFFTMGRELGDF